jgi:hypothetical protein
MEVPGSGGGARWRTAQDPGSGGAQDAAEAMPYHMHRRTDCNTDQLDPGVAAEPTARHPARPRWKRCEIRSDRDVTDRDPPALRGGIKPAWNTWFEPLALPTSIDWSH